MWCVRCVCVCVFSFVERTMRAEGPTDGRRSWGEINTQSPRPLRERESDPLVRIQQPVMMVSIPVLLNNNGSPRPSASSRRSTSPSSSGAAVDDGLVVVPRTGGGIRVPEHPLRAKVVVDVHFVVVAVVVVTVDVVIVRRGRGRRVHRHVVRPVGRTAAPAPPAAAQRAAAARARAPRHRDPKAQADAGPVGGILQPEVHAPRPVVDVPQPQRLGAEGMPIFAAGVRLGV
mmetsp:Transcript_19311/g.36083  ORF Transcript_19311/g.36083 Transcript_19311/m.36083 type:complete len:230 (-) Transcript_19311:2084-2773(-)